MRNSLLAGLTLLTILAVPTLALESPGGITFPAILNNQTTVKFSDTSNTDWQTVDIFSFINKNTYLTASARSTDTPTMMAVGTSFEGIYESSDNGKTWKFISEAKIFKPLHQGSGFFDEVEALSYANDGTNDLIFRIGFGGKTYRYVRAAKKIIETEWNFDNLPLAPELATSSILPVPLRNDDPDSKASRRQLASDKRAFFLNSNAASGTRLTSNLDFAVKNGINAVVVDFKDDTGIVTYQSALPLAKDIGAIRARINAPDLIKKAHDKGIYVIARIVVFKDPKLYAFQKNAYALWDKKTNKPWGVWRDGVQIESWVDPFSSFVHQYNIDLATEIIGLGADEIQFDYIRFPSDGLVANILARHHRDADGKQIGKEGPQDRIFALATFLSKARENINAPISTDVFGFNGWARMSYLGQDIQAFSRYVDVISPMAYPSHYARDFLPQFSYFDRASYIYKEGTRRSRAIVEDRVLIRPYVQAFLIGNERNFSDPQFFDYLNRQVIGAREGGGNGFALWNQSGNYYMVNQKTFKNMATGD